MATYGDVQTQVRGLLGRTDDSTDAKILVACNTVQKLLAVGADWEDLQEQTEAATLVADTQEYTLRTWLSDTQFVKLMSIQLYANSRWYPPMTQVTPYRWDSECAVDAHVANNKPRVFSIWKRNVRFFPTPDDAYTLKVRYYIKPSELVATTDDLAYDELYLPMIVYATAGFVWAALEELELAKALMATADGFVGEFQAFNDKMFNFSSFISTKHTQQKNGPEAWNNPFVSQIGG